LTFFVHLGKFDIEKQNLLDELNTAQRARDALEQEKRLHDQELRQLRDRTRASSDELKNTQDKVRILEQQVSFY
jgi:chromosome segregation ATPase